MTKEKPKPWKERRKEIRHRWLKPIVFIEWNCEKFSYNLSRWAFLEILEKLGRLTIIVAVIFFFLERDDRRKAKHYLAWQVINSANGQTGSGGRIDALQDLNNDNIPLAYIKVLGANLAGIEIPEANLWGANLQGVNLLKANLQRACLWGANLQGANLQEANLQGAVLLDIKLQEAYLLKANLQGVNLFGANLRQANMLGTKLQGADLSGVNLQGANLIMANLHQAILIGANLQGADLQGANLIEANLWGVNLHGVNLLNIDDWQRITEIDYANIYGIKNPPDGFIKWAKENGAVEFENHEEWEKYVEKGKKKKR